MDFTCNKPDAPIRLSLTHRKAETETVKTEQWEGGERDRYREREMREGLEGGEEGVESELVGRGGRETDAEAEIDSIGEIRR